MKKSQITIFSIVFVIVTSSCRPSESQIVTAMAQTEIVHSATYVVETKTLATESAMRTSAAQSTYQAATTTGALQETATRAAEETSTILAATATASSMQRQVQELVDSGILSRSDGAYYLLAPEFDKLSEGPVYPWWDTGFAPADFVIRFDYSCPFAVQDDPAGIGLAFRQNNANFYSLSFWSGRVRITRILDLDFKVPDDWQPGDPIFIDMSTPLGGVAIPEDEKEIRSMLVVEGSFFTVFANGEKLFHAYNTSLTDGNLLLFWELTETDCQMENIELWILD